MSNTKIIFLGSEVSGTDETELECFANDKNEIYITIRDSIGFNFICLDLETSEDLLKKLEDEIQKLHW